MTTESTPSPNAARLERTYDAPAELIWKMLTTAAGLEEWWAPDGFESRVSELDLRPGGQLRYAMIATAPEQVAFMADTGNPISVELRKTFTEVARQRTPQPRGGDQATHNVIAHARGRVMPLGGAGSFATFAIITAGVLERSHSAERGFGI